MKILGLDIRRMNGALTISRRTKAVPQGLQSVWNYGGGNSWYNLFGPVLEADTFNWQRNIVVAPTQTILQFSPVYVAVTGIAADVSKMRLKLSKNDDGIWKEVTANQPWLPLLRNPNRYQDRIKFIESWMISKLIYGNTYVLKERRDARGIVTALYILHPNSVRPLVAEDGEVYYEIDRDDLSGVKDTVVVRSSEIIHDRFATLWHPLIGVSPLYACGMSATMGTTMQTNSTYVFNNRMLPTMWVEVPGEPTAEQLAALSASLHSGSSGANAGKAPILSDGMKLHGISMTAEALQLIEQLKFTVEDCARAFRYPMWKFGGSAPPYSKPDEAQTMYHRDCLQPHIEAIELCLDHGLELPAGLGTEFDVDDLLRMDTASLYESLNSAKNFMKVDEQRYKANLEPLKVGGDTVYRQDQDHAIETIAELDRRILAGEDVPTAPPSPEPGPEPTAPEPDEEKMLFDDDDREVIYSAMLRKELTGLVA